MTRLLLHRTAEAFGLGLAAAGAVLGVAALMVLLVTGEPRGCEP